MTCLRPCGKRKRPRLYSMRLATAIKKSTWTGLTRPNEKQPGRSACKKPSPCCPKANHAIGNTSSPSARLLTRRSRGHETHFDFGGIEPGNQSLRRLLNRSGEEVQGHKARNFSGDAPYEPTGARRSRRLAPVSWKR